VRHLREEARAVVPPRTHHPCLLMWGGGNELHDGGVPLDEARSPALAALRDEVARLDPRRHWVPTSPSGPAFHHRLDVIAAAPDDQHDVHGPWEHQGPTGQHTLADAGTCLAHTEFGVEGMANLRTLHALVPPADRWPADRTNPVYRHLGEWWDNAELVQRWFGGRLGDMAALQRASQLLQATGLAYAVEADRRRAPRCSMVLPWQLGESYPNAWCTSAVDFRGDPKPAFHAVSRAFGDRRVTARVPTSVWAGRPTATVEAWVWSAVDAVPAGSTVAATLRTADGAAVATASGTLDGPVGGPLGAVTLDAPLTDVPADAVLIWDLRWDAADGTPLDRETVLACAGADLAPLLDLPRAAVDITPRPGPDGDWQVDVVHRSGPVVVGLRLVDARPADAPGWAVVDADPRPLLPGDSTRLTVHWRGARDPGAGPRIVRLESWNTDPVDLHERSLT
jgi:beta-mannosidase